MSKLRWRVRADIILSDEKEATDIFKSLKRESGKFETINEGEPNEERSRISIEKCHYDEESPKPCEVIEIIESEGE